MAAHACSRRSTRTLERMNLRHPTSLADRCVLALAGGCFGLVFGALLTFVVLSPVVIWYTAAYFMVVCLVLGPAAADIAAMVLAATALLFAAVGGAALPSTGYEKNPFNKPWHWLLLGLFVVGLIAVVAHASRR